MEILVAYDVATEDAAGRRRLRRVAHACEAYGQRVQKSVFECVISDADVEVLTARLRAEMDEAVDSIRVYRLREPLGSYLQVFGVPQSLTSVGRSSSESGSCANRRCILKAGSAAHDRGCERVL